MNVIKPKDRSKYHLLPSQQLDARTQFIDYYFTGEPCTRGHVSIRGAKSGSCYECTLLNNRKKHYQYNHKCSDEQIKTLLEDQKKLCAICGKSLEHKFDVDHCHKTGFIRGILCHLCNIGLGHFYDNQIILQSAINYLNQPPTTIIYKSYKKSC